MPRLQKCLVQHQDQEWRKAIALSLDKDRGEGGEKECDFVFFFFFWFLVVAASCCEESQVHQEAHETAQARSSRRRNRQRCRQLRECDGISVVVNRVGYRQLPLESHGVDEAERVVPKMGLSMRQRFSIDGIHHCRLQAGVLLCCNELVVSKLSAIDKAREHIHYH
ncbi:trans-resveratrol di-O-methyltransferase-like [Iris pallida]|uniref:Trans-resveratrol di-O-methyltransferase-like n=1 Tax=Iris pallida TaxID=29817 RepID=A0AAX6GEH0_IRIPA|nr:trans-resveratrol di-O-methyltransferase-like [Iris pallida]